MVLVEVWHTKAARMVSHVCACSMRAGLLLGVRVRARPCVNTVLLGFLLLQMFETASFLHMCVAHIEHTCAGRQRLRTHTDI